MNEIRKKRPSFRGGDRPGSRSERPSSRGEKSSYRSSERPSFRGGSKTAFNSEERGKFGKALGGRKFADRDDKKFGGRDERPFRGREERSFGSRDERRYEKRPVVTAPKPEREDDGTVRLNKFIANSGICSRREADEFIQAGLVTVNGNVVTELGVRVKRTDDIRFNGERMKGEKKVYILMNKPKDYVTTTSDPHAEKDVMQLISKEMCPERIFPVGRLDKATTGVLLLTNDGELTEKLTHPSYQKKKIYQVDLDRNFHQDDMDKLVQGISLEDGVSFADEAAYVDGDKSVIGVEIHSGKNRIVRRMFEALGYNVRKLDRVYFAGLTKKNLRRGQWRFLSEEEVRMLKMNFYE